MDELTSDTFFDGRLQVLQSLAGYRFSIDAVLLSGHVACLPGSRILDLGTGCGIISMMLAFRFPESHVCGVEIQPDLAALAMRNVIENRLQDRVRVIQTDLKTVQPADVGGTFDIAVCNPPYRRIASGRMNPNRQKAVARHEIESNITDVAAAARRTLKVGGRLFTVYPAERFVDLLLAMRGNGLEPKTVRTIHSRRNTHAKLVVVMAAKGGGTGIRVMPPLVIYRSNGVYSRAVERMFQP